VLGQRPRDLRLASGGVARGGHEARCTVELPRVVRHDHDGRAGRADAERDRSIGHGSPHFARANSLAAAPVKSSWSMARRTASTVRVVGSAVLAWICVPRSRIAFSTTDRSVVRDQGLEQGARRRSRRGARRCRTPAPASPATRRALNLLRFLGIRRKGARARPVKLV